jgi:pimeloyl-ACP methyl ester carboxylesterase
LWREKELLMFVELRGQRVHTVEFGRGDTTIVGVSGAFGDWEIWLQPFELLSRSFRTIAYDHFGTGETRVPPELVVFDEQVALLEALLDAFSVERCVLAGDSNMVAVAVEVAARHPERIEALALVAGGVVHQPDDRVTGFVAGLRSNFAATVDGFVSLCVPEPDSLHLRDWLRDIIHRTGGERAARLVESFYGVDVSSRLPELTMPVVVVQGEKDSLPTSRLEAARQMAAQIPDCTFEVLSGIGHVPTLTRPNEVAAIIKTLADRSHRAAASAAS